MLTFSLLFVCPNTNINSKKTVTKLIGFLIIFSEKKYTFENKLCMKFITHSCTNLDGLVWFERYIFKKKKRDV